MANTHCGYECNHAGSHGGESSALPLAILLFQPSVITAEETAQDYLTESQMIWEDRKHSYGYSILRGINVWAIDIELSSNASAFWERRKMHQWLSVMNIWLDTKLTQSMTKSERKLIYAAILSTLSNQWEL